VELMDLDLRALFYVQYRVHVVSSLDVDGQSAALFFDLPTTSHPGPQKLDMEHRG
jgi:hypothetical protein